MDGWLIDGQQRMRAIAAYLADEFQVFGVHWSELERPDKFRIHCTGFPAYVLKDHSEADLLERYLKLNYSGTPHTAADKRRAMRHRKKPATNQD